MDFFEISGVSVFNNDISDVKVTNSVFNLLDWFSYSFNSLFILAIWLSNCFFKFSFFVFIWSFVSNFWFIRFNCSFNWSLTLLLCFSSSEIWELTGSSLICKLAKFACFSFIKFSFDLNWFDKSSILFLISFSNF